MVIDIILIVIVLIFAIIGLKKGLIESILSLFGTLVSLTIAIMTCKPVANFLEKTFKLTAKISEYVLKQLVSMGGEIFETAAAPGATASQIIEDSKLQSIVKIITKALVGNKEIAEGQLPGTVIADILAGVILLIAAVIATFILLRIVIWLLTKVFDKILQNRAIGGLDRFLGLIFGLVKAALLVGVIFVAATFALSTGFGSTIQKAIDDTTVTKAIFEPVKEYTIEKIGDIDFNKIVEDFFNK